MLVLVLILYLYIFTFRGTASLTSNTRTFSTYTAYEAVRGDIRKERWPDYLQPVKVYFVARHGSRNLGDDTHDVMMNFLEVVQKNPQLSTRYSWLEEWTVPTLPNNKELVPQGMLEHYEMGARFRSRLPDLLSSYDPIRCSNRATYKHRTSQSSSAFMYGAFKDTGPLSPKSTAENISFTGYEPVSTENASPNLDILLRFFDNCPNYDNSAEYVTAKEWKSKFSETREFELEVVHAISQEIGIKLTQQESLGLFFLCALETYSPTTTNNSHFCNLLPKSASDYVEYCYDLQHYLEVGYPSNLGYKASCTLLEEVVDVFKAVSSNPKVVLRFGHRETLQPLVTLLGLYDNQTVDNFEELKSHRSYRGADITPFAGNVAFILFNDTRQNTSVIKVYLNEKAASVPFCNHGYECTLSELEDIIISVSSRCNFAEMCAYEEAVKPVVKPLDDDSVMISSWLLLLLVAFSFFSACYLTFTFITWVNSRFEQMRDGYEEIALTETTKRA